MKKFAMLAISILSLVIVGCASNFHFYNAGGGGFMRPQQPADTARVTGRIVYVEDGVEKRADFFSTGMQSTLLNVYNVDRQRIALHDTPGLKPDGAFEWIASPGTYVIRGFKIARMGFDRDVQPQVAFHVPQGASGVYVGTLRVSYVDGKMSDVSVVDEAGATAPGAIKLLMVHDKNIPVDPHRQTKSNMSAVITGFGEALIMVAPALVGAPL